MKTQNFQNHTRFYPFHHFILTPLTLIYFGWTVKKADFSSLETTSDSLLLILGGLCIALFPLLARIYALKNQNRIILMEMRMRYFHLTGNPFDEQESKLRLAQIIALRFADDKELLPLMQKAINENLKPKEIKQLVKNWRGDYRRV